MNQFSQHIGMRIRRFRKIQGLTLQQMADQLDKSKATMSKYESGDIILDVETLYAIANLLNVSINQLTDYRPEGGILPGNEAGQDTALSNEKEVSLKETSRSVWSSGRSPFFQADQLFFYYYDGRYRRLKSGTIRITRKTPESAEGTLAEHPVTVTIASGTPLGHINEEFYTGAIAYSEMLLRVSFVSQHNEMEKNILYVFNPPAGAETAEGLLSGIATSDQTPCAFKCAVSLHPQDTDLTGELMHHLTFTKRQLQRLQKLNMLLADQQE